MAKRKAEEQLHPSPPPPRFNTVVAKLVCVSEGGESQSFELNEGIKLVGRGNSLPVDEMRLSRRHCEFWVMKKGPLIMVVRYGLNKVQIKRHDCEEFYPLDLEKPEIISHGDQIQFLENGLIYELRIVQDFLSQSLELLPMSNSFKSNSVNTQNSQNSSNSNSNHSMIISKSTLLNKPELKDSSVQTSPFSINFPQAIGCIEKLFERNEKICERSKSKKGQELLKAFQNQLQYRRELDQLITTSTSLETQIVNKMKEVENTQITSVDHELQEILDYGENLESLKPNFEEFSFQFKRLFAKVSEVIQNGDVNKEIGDMLLKFSHYFLFFILPKNNEKNILDFFNYINMKWIEFGIYITLPTSLFTSQEIQTFINSFDYWGNFQPIYLKISKLINLSRISDEISNINSKELSNITKIRMKIFEKQKKYDEMKNLSLILIDDYFQARVLVHLQNFQDIERYLCLFKYPNQFNEFAVLINSIIQENDGQKYFLIPLLLKSLFSCLILILFGDNQLIKEEKEEDLFSKAIYDNPLPNEEELINLITQSIQDIPAMSQTNLPISDFINNEFQHLSCQELLNFLFNDQRKDSMVKDDWLGLLYSLVLRTKKIEFIKIINDPQLLLQAFNFFEGSQENDEQSLKSTFISLLQISSSSTEIIDNFLLKYLKIFRNPSFLYEMACEASKSSLYSIAVNIAKRALILSNSNSTITLSTSIIRLLLELSTKFQESLSSELFDYVTEHTIQWEQGLEVVKHLKELNKVEDALIACEEIIQMKGNNGRLEAISQIVEQEVSFYPQAIHRIIIKICQIEPSLTIYTKCKNIISEKDQWKRARSEILVGIQRIALGLVNSESSQIEFPSDQTLKSILEIYVSEGQYPYIQQLSDYNVLNQKHALFIAGEVLENHPSQFPNFLPSIRDLLLSLPFISDYPTETFLSLFSKLMVNQDLHQCSLELLRERILRERVLLSEERKRDIEDIWKDKIQEICNKQDLIINVDYVFR